MANDTSCRPHELLSLKLKDIKFKVSSTGIQYAEVHIVESKTKPRTIPLIFSIPYVKDWIDSLPLVIVSLLAISGTWIVMDCLMIQ
jgi:integrase